MELRHLRYFVAVAEEGGFTRAAERLGMQQPPLSQQIKALETELGFRLFERLPKGVELTAGGRVFLEEALALLGGVQAAVHRASRAAKGLEGSLSVGFTISVAVHRLASGILREFRRRFPGVAISFREGNAAELTEMVSSGRLQAALLRVPVARPPELAFVTLLEEAMVLALPSQHPLAVDSGPVAREAGSPGESAPLSLSVLVGEPLILVRRPGAPGMYADLVQACRNLGFEPQIAVEVEHMLTNLLLVAAGVGISIVPASMADVHREGVVYRAMQAHPGLGAPITLAHRADETSPAARHFLELARSLAAESGGI